MSIHASRRQFIGYCAAAAAAGLVPGAASAEDLPKVDESGPQATALGYHHDATAVDKAKYANFEAGRICSGCQLWQGGDAEWGPCSIFPGKAVNANGWCTAWVKKAG